MACFRDYRGICPPGTHFEDFRTQDQACAPRAVVFWGAEDLCMRAKVPDSG
ncbi:hypothetical protein M407DRAFT_28902 [Tulasnella calospora MUT 4182]|uniref:Uncharacterized protein n=1 Tax=Tulasnella calospora MUT 4182 TaxID=1051891 RepID=A0A0C3Q0I6_9AGAM|nr:hypothetical protein M407DRAFT_28902 [Tulasnella calospora MUT 4182]